ncbi:MAG: prephenate dehydrogenase [Candidatus Dormibacteraeota bacterium]|nr:prephenate dehydrogenase [Candidatus Dormibacteraeota bacterium]
MEAQEHRAARSVLIVGAGMIGTSVAMALAERGHRILLDDKDPVNLSAAVRVSGGAAYAAEAVDLAVVAVPPSRTGPVLLDLLRSGAAAAVTDCASVKAEPLRVVTAGVCAWTDDERPVAARTVAYVGGHPLAGRERRGPRAARVDLFAGRPWVLTPHEGSSSDAVSAAEWAVRECRATPVFMTPAEHDRAVAVTSHLPQMLASALAGQLEHEDDHVLALAGQGLRDMTRIAGSDPELWSDIVTGNADAVAEVLDRVASRLLFVAGGLRDAPPEVAAEVVRALVESGRSGRQRMPGKHGESPRVYRAVPVVVPDERGQLARLLGDAAEANVNIEDIRVDHAPGLPVGLIELYVAPDAEETLSRALALRGWTLTSLETDET